MIVRIVKMTFDPSGVSDFLKNFAANKEAIRASEGCLRLELLQQHDAENVFFTYSWWDDPQSLENYRHSQLFKEVWAFTKALFCEKPEAWSVVQKEILQ